VTLRLLLADDHDIVRRGLRDILEEHDGWLVCAEARNGREAVELALTHRPDIALLDLTMPELNGLEATRQIRKELPTVEILIFTMHETEQLVREVVFAGARGYVLKSDAAQHLVSAVEALALHRPFFTSRVSETILAGFLKAGREPEEQTPGSVLTARERQIVQMLAEGQSNRDIADALVISTKTVETHRAAIMRKLGINSVVELVRYAIRNQLVLP
jgi:DNA-binding NarL/FixJ family response regulator